MRSTRRHLNVLNVLVLLNLLEYFVRNLRKAARTVHAAAADAVLVALEVHPTTKAGNPKA